MTALPTDIPYDAPRSSAVLLFGDDAGRRHHLAHAIAISGGRVVASEPTLGAAERLGAQAGAAGVVLDLREDGGPWLDGLLARLNAHAAMAGRLSTLILTPLDLLDIVAARVADPGVAVLVDPEPEELDAALTELVAPLPRTVSDTGGEKGSRQLAQLSEESSGLPGRWRSCRSTRGLRRSSRRPYPSHRWTGNWSGRSCGSAGCARNISCRRLFADPAWDILLDLAAARIERRRVAVSSLCIAAAVPATTALRWIAQMTEQHLLIRHPDPRDGRRVFIGLSEQAALAMENYLATARRIVAPVG